MERSRLKELAETASADSYAEFADVEEDATLEGRIADAEKAASIAGLAEDSDEYFMFVGLFMLDGM